MSYFDDASLVMIPSGYKDQKVYSVKPIDGSGDLTFSRASNATRVNSSGLVEKVRTNEMFPSDTTNTGWAASGTGTFTVVQLLTNQQDPNGGNTGFRFTANVGSTISDRAFYRKTLTISADTRTWSFWVKSANGSAQTVAFHFIGGANQTVSVTNEWQRVEYTASTSAGGFAFGVEIRGTLTDLSCDLFLYGWQLEISDFGATPYIQTSTASVSTGPVSGLPRLDYSGGASCPSLLLEPSATTLIPYSEQMDNAAWDKTSGGAAITANSVTSPDGYTNADTITGTGAGVAFVLVRQTIAVPSAGTYTFSGFFKYNNHAFVSLNLSAYDGGGSAYYNIQTGVLGTVSAGASATITDYGNGWYRCTLTAAIGASDLSGRPSVYVAYEDGTSDFPTTGDAAGKAAYAWGFNLTQTGYVQSYIPTLSSAVTRVADAASKTGIASLIGQTEGTIFVEFESGADDATNHILSLSDGTTSNRISLVKNTSDDLRAFVASGGASQASILWPNYAPNTNIKAAISYKANEIKFYANGENAGTDTSAIVPASLTQVEFETSGSPFAYPIKQLIVFPTALSATELATLTA